VVMLFQSHTQECFQVIDSPEFEPMSSNPNSHTFHCLKLGVCVGGGGGDMRKERERENLSIISGFLCMPISSLRT